MSDWSTGLSCSDLRVLSKLLNKDISDDKLVVLTREKLVALCDFDGHLLTHSSNGPTNTRSQNTPDFANVCQDFNDAFPHDEELQYQTGISYEDMDKDYNLRVRCAARLAVITTKQKQSERDFADLVCGEDDKPSYIYDTRNHCAPGHIRINGGCCRQLMDQLDVSYVQMKSSAKHSNPTKNMKNFSRIMNSHKTNLKSLSIVYQPNPQVPCI